MPYGAPGQPFNEIVVDAIGRVWVDMPGSMPWEEGKPGITAVVLPDGSSQHVADDVWFPNGMVILGDDTLVVAESHADRLTAWSITDAGPFADRRVWTDLAPGSAPDGIGADGWHLPGLDTGRIPTVQRCETPACAMTLVIAARLTCDTLLRGVGLREERAMEIINLGAADGLPPVEWDAVIEKLDAGSAPAPDAHNARTKWLATINEDGSAHITAVGALWLDGTFWFQTGPRTRKGRNVARDPRCSIAVSIRDADVVVEGDATRVTEPGAVARIAQAWADDGWPAEPDEGGSGITAPFNAPSQGPPPWNVYRIEPRSATVVLGTEPGGLTRFRF